MGTWQNWYEIWCIVPPPLEPMDATYESQTTQICWLNSRAAAGHQIPSFVNATDLAKTSLPQRNGLSKTYLHWRKEAEPLITIPVASTQQTIPPDAKEIFSRRT
jgi:hypothetical protein